MVPLDDQRQWYRVHDLLREVLLARLQASEPELVPRLHQRAARWYAAHDELARGDRPHTGRRRLRVCRRADRCEAPYLWLSGEARTTVQAWILVLPQAVLLQHARLALNTALRLLESLHLTVRALYARGRAQVEQTVARLEVALQRQQGVVARSAADETVPACQQRTGADPAAHPPAATVDRVERFSHVGTKSVCVCWSGGRGAGGAGGTEIGS